MKKVPLLFKSFSVVLFLLFCSAGVFAETVTVSDNVPKTINVQGKLTTDSGQPITGSKEVKLTIKVKNGSEVTMSNSNVPVDSDGIYTTDIDVKNVDFSKGIEYFKVTADGVESGQSNFATSPYAFYASSSTYALVLSTSSPVKLQNGNFDPSETYKINVDTANYAVKSSSIAVSTNVANVVWGYNGSQQTWIDVSSAVQPAIAKSADKLNYGIGKSKLEDGNFYTPSSHTYEIKVTTADFAAKASTMTPNGSKGQIWTMKSASEQGWMNLSSATTSSIGGLKLDDAKNTGLTMDNQGVLKVTTAPYAVKSSSIAVSTTATNIVVWGYSNNKQSWIDVGSAVSPALAQSANKLNIGGDASKLEDGNFYSSSSHTYTIKVGTAAYAVKSSSIAVSTNVANVVWGYNGSQQTWIDVGSAVSPALAQSANKLNIGGDASKLEDGNFYSSSSHTYTIKVGTAAYADVTETATNATTAETAETANALSSGGSNGQVWGIVDGAQTWTNVQVAQGEFVVGAGLEMDTDNELKVVGIGISTSTASTAVTPENNKEYYVWAYDKNANKQRWIKTKYDSSLMGGHFTTGADLAEIYQSTEKLVPGDVVSIDTTKDNAIVKTKVAEDTLVAGVISTEPGLLMNQNEKGYKLALVGKVPTKVCNEGGAIKRGDMLVSASVPGYAKKAGANPKVGTVIGKALESLDSQKGTILVLVNLQ